MGAEIDTEYTAIQTAIASKADIASPIFTGTVTRTAVAGNATHAGTETFTASPIVSMASPLIKLVQSGATVLNVNWGMSVSSELFSLRVYDDSFITSVPFLEVDRTANTIDNVKVPGLTAGAPTGGYVAGTVNAASGVYDNGNRVYSDTSDVTSTTALSGTAGTVITLAHGYGTVPSNFEAVLVCTSTDGGYASGDEVRNFSYGNDTNDNGAGSVYADATNVGFVVPAGGYALKVSKRSATVGTAHACDLTKWSVKLRAWK